MKYKSVSIFITCFLIVFTATSQSIKPGKFFIDTTTALPYVWKWINIGFPEEMENNSPYNPDEVPDSIIHVNVDTISENQFLQFSKNYSSKIIMDTSVIFKTDSSFTLRNKNFEKTFPAFRICECTASSYLGLIAPLNLYIVSTVDMHSEIAYSNLIDSKTGKSFDVPGCSDPGPQAILISPKGEFLLIYDNSYYEHDNCCIYLIGIDKDKRHRTFTLYNYLNLNFDRLNIKKLAWINESSFVMSVTEQTEPKVFDENKKLKYFLKISLVE